VTVTGAAGPDLEAVEPSSGCGRAEVP
jgi:hypothetical protein